ncbi:hypothetical protein LC608_01925 [Nostoc sp. XA010]|uniref:hypothetical protein n=1 Tax=Nostoc sp. XA010 TaxID=2780407 RepID=UPI001E358AEA|nr:hypothetical protein [Nostoc sp. XA010]MCC5655761.1 hypothetical protein [Nostoc sp. XA010]
MIMLNLDNYSNQKKNQILLGLAIIFSLILCFELAIRAYSFSLEALANSTGQYIPDFSKNIDKIRVGIEYRCLIIIYIVWLIINKNKKRDISFIKILKNSSFFLLIAFISYPISISIGWVTLILFMFAAPWYCPWYSSVLLGVLALNIHSKRFAITSIGFCIISAIA